MNVSPQRLEELLRNWARWCRGRTAPNPDDVLTSVWDQYQATGEEAEKAKREPRPVPPNEWDGLLVERMLIRMPEFEREILRAEYVHYPRRTGETEDQLQERRRRRMHLPRWMYADGLRRGKLMLTNLLRRHGLLGL